MLTEMANLLNRLCLSFCPSVPFAAHHELPGDASDAKAGEEAEITPTAAASACTHQFGSDLVCI
jgi:hypothetical protein